MSIAIYRPYFYIIQHIESKKFYAGVKYGKNANPDNLLKSNGYQTSSNFVKQIILDEGLESFVIRKIKIFETAEQALDYESRFLRKVNASFNESFLNKSNNSVSTINGGYEKFKQSFLNLYGVENPSLVSEFQEKRKQTYRERYGVSHPSQVPEFQEKRKQNYRERYGVSHPSQVPEFQEKKKQNFLKNHGVANPSQVPEFQEKKKQTFFKNYGVEYPSQVPEFQEKRSQTVNIRNNRPTVLLIRKYRDEFKLKLGSRWFWKPQEFLDGMLSELKINYGELK